MANKRWAMVIDLHRCVGCAACDIACKTENNVTEGFHWSNHILETSGRFPDVRYRYTPTLCNHCENAPCVSNCPTTAMYKTDEGLTLHDPDICIGCGACILSCPYGAIYRNGEAPHARWQDDQEAIPGCTASAQEVTQRSGAEVPYYNPARAETYAGIRPVGVPEKCTFCDHRLAKGLAPWCVVSCPTGARIFGDLEQSDSPPRRALARYAPRVLQREKGTKPNVFYIRDY